MTHHAPVGAWSSLTFGLPGAGVGIETECLSVARTGDLVIACSHGPNRTIALPFFASGTQDDYEGRIAGNGAPAAFRSWHTVAAAKLLRQLTPSTDEFQADTIRFRVTSPRFECHDPVHGQAPPRAFLPALLLELEIDNTGGDEPATGFLGFAYKEEGRIRPLDWSDKKLAGIAFQDRWALAALSGPDVFTIRAGSVASYVEQGKEVIHPGGNEGGIGFRVAPGSISTLTVVLGFYRTGNAVAQGLTASYAYTHHWHNIEEVCHGGLAAAAELKDAGLRFDSLFAPAGGDPVLTELMAQASQGYYANSSLLIDERNRSHWSVCEGQFAWRNTLDLAVDHLPFELTAHPWVARNVIDSFIDSYSYRDKLRFDGETEACHPGGISFTHDQGNYTACSPLGQSGYEQPDREGVYSFMTTEQLLNGAYCAAACALLGDDKNWSQRRLPVAVQLLESLENREHFDPALRDGVLRGQSERVGTGSEITTYDALDHALQNSKGCGYIVAKTWGAALMLGRWFDALGDNPNAARAHALAHRAAVSLESSFLKKEGRFPANLLSASDSLVIALLDPLAVPLFCGLHERLNAYPALIGALREHARTCLSLGACLDETTGGLRLSSTARNTWPSKVALTFAVIQWLEQKSITEIAPAAMAELAGWMQVSAAETTVSDQIDAATRKQISGAYYPRLVTLRALFPFED